MEQLIARFFFQNWQRKIIAFAAAITVWIFVSQSITESKTLANVPIRVINLPSDKTIIGLLPNGYITERATLTLGGSKSVIRELEHGDLEVLLDASTANSNTWVVQILKKNLVSHDPSLDLRHHITSISHPELTIHLSQLVVGKVVISVRPPEGNPPSGYEFLDVWPERMIQTMSGPEEEMEKLKNRGIRLTLNLDMISKEVLDRIKDYKNQEHNDEISFPVPDKWKEIYVPFRHNMKEPINDPEAKNLRIDFLRKNLLPIGKEIPVVVYYPLKTIETINPGTQSLAETELIRFQNGVAIFSQPLYITSVSRLFLDIIREGIEIVIIAAPKSEREMLQWSIEVIDTHEMEDTYVAYVIAQQKEGEIPTANPGKREEMLRKRFRDYMQKLSLFTAGGEKLNIAATLEDNKIIVSSE